MNNTQPEAREILLTGGPTIARGRTIFISDPTITSFVIPFNTKKEGKGAYRYKFKQDENGNWIGE